MESAVVRGPFGVLPMGIVFRIYPHANPPPATRYPNSVREEKSGERERSDTRDGDGDWDTGRRRFSHRPLTDCPHYLFFSANISVHFICTKRSLCLCRSLSLSYTLFPLIAKHDARGAGFEAAPVAPERWCAAARFLAVAARPPWPGSAFARSACL